MSQHDSNSTVNETLVDAASQELDAVEASLFFEDEEIPESALIESAAQRLHDSEHSTDDEAVYDDPTGSLFAGPHATSFPTSVTGFRNRSRSRANTASRRPSTDQPDAVSIHSRRSSRKCRSRKPDQSRRPSIGRRGSASSAASVSSDKSRPSIRRPSLRGKRTNSEAADVTSSSEDEKPAGIMSGITSMFSRQTGDRSDAVSKRSVKSSKSRGRSGRRGDSEDDFDFEDDPNKMYRSSSSDSTSSETSSHSSNSETYLLQPTNRKRAGSQTGAGLFAGFGGSADPFFGDSRIDMPSEPAEGEESDDEYPLLPYDIDDVSSSHQPIYIADEDLQILLVGWKEDAWRSTAWRAGVIASLGILSLVGRWTPKWALRGKGKEREFIRASNVVAYSSHGGINVIPIKTIDFPHPVPVSSIFPPGASKTPPSSRNDVSLNPVEKSAQQSGTNSPTKQPPATPETASLRSGKEPRLKELKYVDYRYHRFILHPSSGLWRMSRDWKDPLWSTTSSLRRGVSDADRDERARLFGNNSIEIEARTMGQLLMDEVLHPFYVFQIASILLWSIDEYWFYAITIAIISGVSIITTLFETKANVERMREMSRFSCNVQTWRKGSWQIVDSAELVPGDLVDIAESSLHTFPADMLLLSGDAIVNESMLTGESVPVSKTPIENEALQKLESIGCDVPGDVAKHFLFCGTKIVRVRRLAGPHTGKSVESVAMVVRTGFNTTKGALVRSMLFPKPMGFKFYRDSFRFIGVLAIIAALGFLISLVHFIELGVVWWLITVRALDLITIVVPPALPATMSIGTSFAISRLRKAGIFCISPNRVNIGGKINVVCFDKTGTLTEEGLDVLGVRSVDRISKRFSDLYEDPEDVPIIGVEDAKTPFLHALATCHGLKLVDGEVIGDPLDVRMFQFTKWTLEEGAQSSNRPSLDEDVSPKPKSKKHHRIPDRPATLVQSVVRPPGGEAFKLEDALRAGKKHAHFLELGVIRTFDFASSLRRMSVLVKKLKSKTIEAYVKGAPEVMSEICDKSSLPEDYEELLSEYTKHGYRVIAIAAKSMPNMTWVKAQRLTREEVESNLRFIGLIIFENKLKPGTRPALRTLINAHIPCRMCTGDNIRTAISVARESGMIDDDAHIFMPTFVKGHPAEPSSVIEWTHVDDDRFKLDAYSLKPFRILEEDESGYSDIGLDFSDFTYHLAVSGDVFRWMVDYGALETLQRMLVKGVVFARMSPDEKHELVERLQALGYTVGFCGDGANDCGALKAADVGLSLSEAEASVAAPFTSRSPDISCFIEVIKEGRAALVTSFSCFKFMALYSLIQFTTVTLLYALASSLGDFQFLYIDLLLILPIAVTMGRTEAYSRIHPKRPTANLVSKKVLTSLLGQVLITSSLQIFVFAYVRTQSWYRPMPIELNSLDVQSYENTVLFLISQFQYIIVAIVFCVGPPYRKSLHSNVLLLFTIVGLFALSTYILFSTKGFVFDLLVLMELPREFHLELALMVVGNLALAWVWEKHWSAVVAAYYGKMLKKYRRWRGTRRIEGDKIYKSVARDME